MEVPCSTADSGSAVLDAPTAMNMCLSTVSMSFAVDAFARHQRERGLFEDIIQKVRCMNILHDNIIKIA